MQGYGEQVHSCKGFQGLLLSVVELSVNKNARLVAQFTRPVGRLLDTEAQISIVIRKIDKPTSPANYG